MRAYLEIPQEPSGEMDWTHSSDPNHSIYTLARCPFPRDPNTILDLLSQKRPYASRPLRTVRVVETEARHMDSHTASERRCFPVCVRRCMNNCPSDIASEVYWPRLDPLTLSASPQGHASRAIPTTTVGPGSQQMTFSTLAQGHPQSHALFTREKRSSLEWTTGRYNAPRVEQVRR